MAALKQFAVLTCLAVIAGCGGGTGPSRYEVNGTVSIDDEPLSAANIQFLPRTDDIANAPTAVGYVKDGAFRIVSAVGPIAGPHEVEILLSKKGAVEINDEGEEEESEELAGVLRTAITVDPDGDNQFDLKFSSSEVEEVSNE